MIINADCLDAMAQMPAASVDAIVTDPPYGLEFMGKEWDRLWDTRRGGDAASPGYVHPVKGKSGDWRNMPTYGTDSRTMQEWHQRWATEALRVAKPGAYLLAFGGTRTYHRLACAIEDAGWIIRDTLSWNYASGFPKSRSLLKPSWEPIVCARKPFSIPLQSLSEIHHALAALIWLTEGSPDGHGCIADRVASLFADADTTATSKSPAAGSTSSSIALSWSGILAASSVAGSKYTTSTATRLTTALRTLRSCLSPVISATTMPACGCLLSGSLSSASTAASGSTGDSTSWLATLRRSVPESAIAPLAQSVAAVCASLAADLSDDLAVDVIALGSATTEAESRADSRPIVMARKPGPLRELAIDACRIGTDGERIGGGANGTSGFAAGYKRGDGFTENTLGRWPANVVLTDPIFDGGIAGVVGGGETVTATSRGPWTADHASRASFPISNDAGTFYGDSGTYSRFFILPKSDRAEREPLPGMGGGAKSGGRVNVHPT